MNRFHYDIQFNITYDESDIPKPTTFAGSRRPSDGIVTTTVSGTQLTDPQSNFVTDPPAATAAWAIGLASTGFTVLVYYLDKYRENKKKNLAKQAENVRNGVSKADAAFNAKAAAAAEAGFTKMDLGDFRFQIEQKIRASVKMSMDANKSPDEISNEAAEAAKTKVKEFATAYLQSSITGELAQYKNLLGNFVVDRAVRNAIGKAVDARSGRFNADGSYMIAITGAEVARYTVEAKEAAARTMTDDLARAKMAADEEFKKLKQKKDSRDDYVAEKKNEHITEQELENDAQYRSLSAEIETLEGTFAKALDAENASQTESDKIEKERKDAVEEEKRARDHADAVAQETFRGKA